MRLIQSVWVVLLLNTYVKTSSLAHVTQSRGSRWSAMHAKRSLHAPSTVNQPLPSVSGPRSTGRQWCNKMNKLEELHGRWEASNAPAEKVECPIWAEDINCFHMHGDMDEEQQKRMREAYNEVYRPHACELHAWDAGGFDRCVANRRVILIGDSLMRQMFQSLACLLGPVTASAHASNWSNTSPTSAVDYPMPGYFGKYVSKQFWGDLQLISGASVHARIFGSFSSVLLEDLLTEVGPLTERDVIVTNFGAWYPRFVKQDGAMVVSSTYQRFERDMADLMRVLRQTPAQILWRSYAPTHFGGDSGAYVSGEDYQDGCKPAAHGEVWYDKWVTDYLSSCGAKCDRVHMLPIFQLSLNRHQSHLGFPDNDWSGRINLEDHRWDPKRLPALVQQCVACMEPGPI